MEAGTKNILMKSSGLIVAGGIVASIYGASKLFFTEDKSSSMKVAIYGSSAILLGVALFNYSIGNKKIE
jgi:hypothetical protein